MVIFFKTWIITTINSKVDVAVIGAGSAGLPAFRPHARTRKTLCLSKVEFMEPHVPCRLYAQQILIAAAEAAHSIEMLQIWSIYIKKNINGPRCHETCTSDVTAFLDLYLKLENIDPKNHFEALLVFLISYDSSRRQNF
ncbi:MAG: hypothetical protein Ct9H300mP28_05670 [Pseudomonadota bacterium]|nr:MAG: hypothetical protein Ct9H300mP28_05670 [Pseudomonadota bacterium]